MYSNKALDMITYNAAISEIIEMYKNSARKRSTPCG